MKVQPIVEIFRSVNLDNVLLYAQMAHCLDYYSQEMEDHFLPFEDKCNLSHLCAGRVMGVLAHVRDMVIKAPDHDPRNIVDLMERYGDAHISDCGWREVDREVWYLES